MIEKKCFDTEYTENTDQNNKLKHRFRKEIDKFIFVDWIFNLDTSLTLCNPY